jgi:hypothetical protein
MPIPVGRISSVRLFQGLCKCHLGVRDSDKVNVIGHQAVTEQRQAIKLRILPQQSHVGQPIGVAVENDLSGIASLRNMMGNIHHDNAWKASHNGETIRTSDAPADL